jgi:hypothetical protein
VVLPADDQPERGNNPHQTERFNLGAVGYILAMNAPWWVWVLVAIILIIVILQMT